MLRTIQEENCVNEAAAPQNIHAIKPTHQSETIVLNRHSSASSSSSMPIMERLEMEDSDSGWDDENSSGNEQPNDNDISHGSSLQNDPLRRLVQLQAARPPRSTTGSSTVHESFLERPGRILCNHSATVDTSDDTSVIVEIPSMSSSGNNGHPNVDDLPENGNMTSEERKQRSLKRSQEEHLLQVILAQKQHMNKLW